MQGRWVAVYCALHEVTINFVSTHPYFFFPAGFKKSAWAELYVWIRSYMAIE
jgi:hypothetical protein